MSRACRLGPFQRLAPVLGDVVSLGDEGPKRGDESPPTHAIRAPIVIVDEDRQQASVVHANPLGIERTGNAFRFEKTHSGAARPPLSRARQRDVLSEALENTDDDNGDTWVTLVGAPPSLFGDVVYEALSAPWAAGTSESGGLLLKGRLARTSAGSAALFGEWTGPGASVAAALSAKSFDNGSGDVRRPRAVDAEPPATEARHETRARDATRVPATAFSPRPRPNAPNQKPPRPAPARQKPPLDASDEEIFFISDDK